MGHLSAALAADLGSMASAECGSYKGEQASQAALIAAAS